MSLLTAEQLYKNLCQMGSVSRRGADWSDGLSLISVLLLLKWASDQSGPLRVPVEAEWSSLVRRVADEQGVNDALWRLAEANPELLEGIPRVLQVSAKFGPNEIGGAIYHLDRIGLRGEDLEFDDTLGRAFGWLVRDFVDAGGKKGGEFYTPQSVARLLVRLVQPMAGQSIYDPCAGFGGMLSESMHYIRDEFGTSVDFGLFGQEVNPWAWATARLALLFNGASNVYGSVLHGDTLANPLHHVGGRLQRFDRVVTNPPFAANYRRDRVELPERMSYGWVSEGGKKADLMFVQHVLSVLKPDGIGAIISPHGPLFREGVEAAIRQKLIEHDRLEAVIGVGANVFYGTAVPACVLVVRGEGGLQTGQRGSVMFINAEREAVTGRSRNYLEPQHIEKIVDVFRQREDVPGFSRVVPVGEIAANRFNLSLRRYVNPDLDQFSGRSLDVRSVMHGGLPAREVALAEPKFQAFGIRLGADLLHVGEQGRYDFDSGDIDTGIARIDEMAGVRESRVLERCSSWWKRSAPDVVGCAATGDLRGLRSHLMSTLRAELVPMRMLDHYQVSGALANWWSDREDDLRAVAVRGFVGVINRWGSTRSKLISDSAGDVEQQVLGVLGDDLVSRIAKMTALERQDLVNTYRSWVDRYGVSLADLEEQRAVASARLQSRLRDLGFT